VANLVSRSTTTNKVLWGRTATEVSVLSWILFGISLAKPKAKSKKMCPTDLVEEDEKAEAELRHCRGLKRKKKTLGRLHLRTSAIHTCYHVVMLSLMIFLIRWVTQVFQPSLL
jgi:hypothetical protein